MVLRSIVQVATANILVSVLGILQALILPRILIPEEYGYWSAYILYFSFAYLFLFGVADGMYIKYAGTPIERLDKDKLASIHLYTQIILLFISILSILIVAFYDEFSLKMRITWYCVIISGYFACENSFRNLLNQMTMRFKLYSLTSSIWRIVLVFGIAFCYFSKISSGLVVVGFSVVGQILTYMVLVWTSRDLFRNRPLFRVEYLYEFLGNMRIGIWITSFALASGLMTGVGKIFLQTNFGLIELANYSFIMSISAIFLQLVQAMSIVLFPVLKGGGIKSSDTLIEFDYLIKTLGILLLLLYYPGKLLLLWIYPEYAGSMTGFFFLLPIVIIQSRIVLVFGNIYKLHGKAASLAIRTIIAVAICTLLTILFGRLIQGLEGVANAAFLSYIIWLILLRSGLNAGSWKRIIDSDDILLLLIVLGMKLTENYKLSFLGIATICLFTIFLKRSKILFTFRKIRIH